MAALFRGSTVKCLEHFRSARFDGDKREALASFCSVTVEPTVRKWLTAKKIVMPAGSALVKVRYYLQHIGYDVTELNALPAPVRDLGRLIAFGVVTFDDAMDGLGIPRRKKGGGQLLPILHGEQGVSAKRKDMIVRFVRAYREDLPQAEAAVPKLGYLNGGVPPHERSDAAAEQKPAPTSIAVRAPEGAGAAALAIGHSIIALHSLLKMNASQLGPQGRDRVRSVAGKNVVFEVSNLLAGLCSETAFKIQHKS